VVVDHIQDDGEAAIVTGIDQILQPLGSSVGVMRSVEIDTVIAPASCPGKLADRHEFHMGYAKPHQVIESVHCGVECSIRGVTADVHLVDDPGRKRPGLPVLVCPKISIVVQKPGRAMNALRLPEGTWVRQGFPLIQDKGIVCARP
jgi:hypothetical protein